MDDDIPFGIRKELIVDINVNPRGIHDVYIKTMIAITVDIPGTGNLVRCAVAGLLAIQPGRIRSTTSSPVGLQQPKN